MAEIVVNLVMDEVVSLIGEGNLLSGVRGDIVGIRDELEFVRPFLRDVDASAERGEIDDTVKIWIQQLRKVSLKLEDVIDKYKLHVQSQRRRGLLCYFDRFTVLNNMPQSTDELALEIHDIRKTIHDIQERGYSYGFKLTEQTSSSNSWENDRWHINESSRVIKTTRKPDVASSFEIYEPRDHVIEAPLKDEEAMKLFCNKVFHSHHRSESSCPPHLGALSRKIVKKCNGLPLAIEAIGGILSTKDKSVSEWQRFYDSLPSEFRGNNHLQNVNKILSLSYLDLPYLLKPCFLYFGIFPEDYSISHGRLVRLWMAEGFIKEIMGITTSEETVEIYLMELIDRSLVQVSRVNSIGKFKNYRVHDLIREFILSRTSDMGFSQLLSKDDDSYFHREARRLSVQSRGENVLASITQPGVRSGVRSVFTFGEDAFPDSFDVGKIIANLKLVKVLDFEDAPIDSLPEEVGNLLLLKYLNLRNTKVKTLPKSIGRLQNLLFLDLKNSLISELPSVINRLRKLRHLLASVKPLENIDYQQEGLKIQEGFGCLEALQKLYFVDASHGRVPCGGPFRDLEKLWQLRKLGIKMLKTKDGMSLCTAIQNMSHLETLDVSTASEKDILDLEHLTSPPQSLQKLYLKGRLKRVPSWISKLQNLVRIELRCSKLKTDPHLLKPLQTLPDLLELKLMDAYDGDNLNFEARGFPQLIVLELKGLEALRSVEVKTEALPCLHTLHISSCPKLILERLPKEIADKLKI